MERFWNTPVFRVILAYIMNALGVTSLAFFIVFPYAGRILEYHTNLLPSGNLYELLYKTSQYLIYALQIAVFYFLVVRPFHLRPVLGHKQTLRHWLVVLLCMGISYMLLSPFQVMFTATNGIGILTFMITGLSEEWMFRGVLIRVLKERCGVIWAVLISSLLFSLAHWAETTVVEGHAPLSKGNFIVLSDLFLFGIVFSVTVWRSRSILWAAFLHCMYDWRPTVFACCWTRMDAAWSALVVFWNASDILTGLNRWRGDSLVD